MRTQSTLYSGLGALTLLLLVGPCLSAGQPRAVSSQDDSKYLSVKTPTTLRPLQPMHKAPGQDNQRKPEVEVQSSPGLVEGFLSIIGGTESVWFWTMVQSFIILGTLIFIYRQVRVQRYATMLQTLGELRRDWNSDRFMRFRQTTCNNYLAKKNLIGMAEGEVLGFFEEIGLLLKKRVVSIEFIWESYSYFVEHYWSMLEQNVKEFRLSSKDDSWYENFQMLRKAVRKYSKKRKCPSWDKTEDEVKHFISGELERFGIHE